MSRGVLRRGAATLACLADGAWRAGRVARLAPGARLGHQQAWMDRLARALELPLEVYGEPPPVRALWVANHVSWLDVVVLGRLRALHFVAKDEVARWPLIGRLARASGTRFVDRHGRRGLRELIDDLVGQLEAGRPVALFPEGTTTAGDVVLRFRPLLFQAAVRAGVPVQPIALRYREAGAQPVVPYLGDDTFAPHLVRVLRRPPQAVEVHFLSRLQGRELAANELARHSAGAIAESLRVPCVSPVQAAAGGETLRLRWRTPAGEPLLP